MTLNFEKYCFPLSTLDHEIDRPLIQGETERLFVALVSSGICDVEKAPHVLRAQAGSLIVSGNPITISPCGTVHVAGCLLQGLAADELGSEYPTAAVMDSTLCPQAPELILRLTAPDGHLAAADASALAYSLVCCIANAHVSAHPFPPLVAAAITEMREHFAEVYGIEELATQLGVTKSHLVRSFSNAVGISPGKYLTSVRVEAAKQLLLHREYSLDIIASLCGFSGANYLCKVFKKATGQTPLEWLEKSAPQATGVETSEWEDRLFL